MNQNSSLHIRLAIPDDAERMLAIYAPVVEKTGVSFEDLPPETLSFRKRITETLEQYPWLVAEFEGNMIGYTYATSHRSRAAYVWSAEVSVYVAVEYRNQRVGTVLYDRLFSVMREQGYRNLYAIVTLPNQASFSLHKRFGFQEIGLHHHAGHKLGQWHDVLWMQHDLFNGEEPHSNVYSANDSIYHQLPTPTPLSKLKKEGRLEPFQL